MFLAEVNYLFILGGLFAIIIVMILVIYLFETASYLKLYRALPSNLGKAIYGYLDKNGDLVSFSDELYTLINVPKGKNLKKAIKAIYFENEKIIAKNQQIEIDLTIEFNGTIGIFEAKNGSPNNFNIYQIYHPFLYYHNSNLPIKEIICVYLVWQKDKQKIKLWAYTFDNPLRLDSIKFIKSKEYILIRK